MTDDIYEQLANTLDSLPNGFPKTPSSIEILLLKKIFSPEEAWLAGRLSGDMESIDVITKRIGLSVEETTNRLTEMSRRGLIWGNMKSGKVRLAPFIVGIYEAQLDNMDHELAHLFEDYLDEGGAELMRLQPALHRVVPTQSAVNNEWILPYDDVRAVLLASKSFRVRDCICRLQQDH
ncbi:MAG: 4Fe-4S ferredoxin, partial [Candidatus Methanofastidiosia archaeon]